MEVALVLTKKQLDTIRATLAPVHDVDYSALAPAQKLRVLAAMGFTAQGGDLHSVHCPGYDSFDGEPTGLRCNCVPDATVWHAPRDVQEYMGDSWNQRIARAQVRDEKH